MNGDEDLGLDIIMGGEHYHIVQQRSDAPPHKSFSEVPNNPAGFTGDKEFDEKVFSNRESDDKKNNPMNLGLTINMDGQTYNIAQKASKLPTNLMGDKEYD